MSKDRYTLRMSVRLLGGLQITELEAAATLRIGNVDVSIEQKGRHLIFKASDFCSRDEASEFLPRLKVGLWNLAIKHGIAFAPMLGERTVEMTEDPITAARNLAVFCGESLDQPLRPVHGLSHEEGHTIYRSDENVRFAVVEMPDLHLKKRWETLHASLSSAVEQQAIAAPAIDQKLSTAIDLYLASFHEASLQARFLTLMTVLEVLAPKVDKHPVATEVVVELHGLIQQRLSGVIDADSRHALECLRDETDFRKKISIGRQIRRLILEETPISDSERQSLAKTVEDAYKLRSNMVHKGVVDLAKLAGAHDVTLRAVRLLLSKRLGLPIDGSQPPPADTVLIGAVGHSEGDISR